MSRYPPYKPVTSERVRYTHHPTRAVMRTRHGDPHDPTIRCFGADRAVAHRARHPACRRARPAGRAAKTADGGAEAAMARAVRQGAAALQSTIPAEPARLPHPGTRLRRAQAGDADAPSGA